MLDELCNSMKIGQLYRVVGIPTHVQQLNLTWSIEACSVQTLPTECTYTLKYEMIRHQVQTVSG